MCTFHTFEKNAFKDLQPPEKSGLLYKCFGVNIDNSVRVYRFK